MTHIHLIGIGGSGLSAIARLLLESGYTVSGSDRTLSPITQELSAAGALISEGHRAENVTCADRVIRSSAIPDENPEVQAALAAGIPVLKRSDFLGELIKGRTCVAVAGSHGKTTTTAMIAWTLVSLGQDPSYIIGGLSQNLHSNAHAGKGSAFVIEADEYDRMFLGLRPDLIVLTYVEYDHPDCFPTEGEYLAAFQEFIANLLAGGTLLICADNTHAVSLTKSVPAGCRALSYALHTKGDYQIAGLKTNPDGFPEGDVIFNGQTIAHLALKIPGEHNLSNALAALAAIHQLHLSPEDGGAALSAFTGTGRRFEVRAEIHGITVIDDYAHHPTKIRATLKAARSRYPGRRIWAVWQPHTYSRTMALMDEFAAAFTDTDQVIVTEVYAAREKNDTFSAAQVVARMQHPSARFIPALPKVAAYLLEKLQPGDVLLTLSAGDADQISAWVMKGLQEMESTNQTNIKTKDTPL